MALCKTVPFSLGEGKRAGERVRCMNLGGGYPFKPFLFIRQIYHTLR